MVLSRVTEVALFIYGTIITRWEILRHRRRSAVVPLQKAFYSNSTSLRYRQLFFEKNHECGLVGKPEDRVGVIGLIKIIALNRLHGMIYYGNLLTSMGTVYGTIDRLVRYVIFTKTRLQILLESDT